jgi:hypothetical protein
MPSIGVRGLSCHVNRFRHRKQQLHFVGVAVGVGARFGVAIKPQTGYFFDTVGYQLLERFPAEKFLPIVREFVVDAVAQLNSCEN